jgi:hypothetical protein
MRRPLVLIAALLTSFATLAVSPSRGAAAAGGWALASFDPLPALIAGEPADITFRVLQHGVHPIRPADWPHLDLRIVVHADGASTSFPAGAAGADDGRFRAAIAVPTTESVALEVVWTGGLTLHQEPIEVPVSTASSAGTTGPGWLPGALGAVGVAAAAVAALELLRGRAGRPGRRQRVAMG